MASQQSESESQGNKLTVTTSPKSDGGVTPLPKGQCLCSPTTHEGSFRCRLHRSTGTGTGSSSTQPPWMKRSKSILANKAVVSVSHNH
ncbi:hypothetical protein TanjilG_32763 [Lupinus angustifolius]|uniref:Uncharacterized protein n=1 Tax=Lupinus angustifolius TaxID=3871 RepID=A0A4P1RFN8_LUPAN|nr:PREDICTED: uncharacterized protein LOC109349791 [Lupinus angustifolius]OIW10023.1 hypothetical protein TanjilG_32763 [Lupinus angustifolius]